MVVITDEQYTPFWRANSFYRYVYDRVSQVNQIPKLADLITERAKQHGLGASWDTPELPASY